MLKIYKNKGVSLIELMVAVALGLVLILSMLAFYSISSKNVADFQSANHDQQKIRKMLNLIETDIENIGGFECKDGRQKAFTDGLESKEIRLPQNIISLGNNIQRKQIVFVHPIIDEYQHTAFGMLDFDKNLKLKSYTPTSIKNLVCGVARSSIHVGSTILEMIPMDGIIYTDTQYSNDKKANNIWAFVALSAAQSRREGGQNIPINTYTPSINDATVMFLSDNGNNNNIPFGHNTVDIFLGFSKSGKGNTDVPDTTFDDAQSLLDGRGGWINPFSSNNNNKLLIDDKSPNANLLSQTLHNANTDNTGFNIKTYPLKSDIQNPNSNTDLTGRVRAIKFKFTFGAYNGVPERKFTRIIRFKNTHLNQD